MIFRPFDWTTSARCREIGSELFFPEGFGPTYAEARRACGACPVRALCLDEAMRREGALAEEYRGGMWGGLTPRERELLYVQLHPRT